jgi:two-component system nitrogen regulation sensor histidine kinase NtrY
MQQEQFLEALPRPSRPVRAARWAARVGLGRKLTWALAAAGLASGVATYAALTGAPPFESNGNTVLLLVNINLVLLLVLGAVVAKRLVQVWAERRRNLAGSRLHVRLVVLFSFVAVTPTIIVAVFSYLFFSFGLQSWFSERVRTALSGSLAVAEAYLHEHQNVIRADVLAMATDLTREAPLLQINPQGFGQVVAAQAALRSLTEAVVFDSSGRILARSGFSFALEFEPVPDWALREANDGGVAVVTSDSDDRVRALVRLSQIGDVYLYVGRFVDPQVLAHMETTQSAVAQYERLEGQRSDFQITFALVFLVVALLFLVAAVWVGIMLATQLARPISALVTAAEQVRAGDLAARVPEEQVDGEFGMLSRAFNRMTNQLQAQQSELIEANRQLDRRRRFTETVLSGVSAGVIGLDAQGRINLPNRSASQLLASELEQLIGEELAALVPEMAELLAEAARRPGRLTAAQVNIVRQGKALNLLVRILTDAEAGEVRGYIVTFDDVTELISAQRKAAWADVARRIAHEIKNPLTPIQLSAERLKRKYLKEIQNDPETFVTCTDTIVRHVGDIGRMVDEFSSFARMPAPVVKPADLVEIIRQAVFLQRNGNPDITFEIDAPAGPMTIPCDARQVNQALINILKNAAEAIHGRAKAEGNGAAEPPPGRIAVRLRDGAGQVEIAVEDNGKGLPKAERDRLTEPYVTTRAKGTGLGLAIVKKIMEDHGGALVLEDREGGGARIRLVFAIEPATAATTSATNTDRTAAAAPETSAEQAVF